MIWIYGNSKKETERLANKVRIFSKDMTMDFDISNYAHVTMKAESLLSVGEIEVSSGEVTPELESSKGYKYLGILKAN